MTRRSHWLAVVGSTTLGLAAAFGDTGDGSAARAQGPNDLQSVPSVQLAPTGAPKGQAPPASVEDAFAPISVDQILPASSDAPRSAAPAHVTVPSRAAPVAYIAPPVPMNAAPVPPNFAPSPQPMATPNPMWGPRWDMAAALNGPGQQAAESCPGGYRSMLDNMIIVGGADYFSNAGRLKRRDLVNAAADLNVQPVRIPDLDPQRMAGFFGVNAGVPFTHDGQLCFQIGGRLNADDDFGEQGFFTMGMYRRTEPNEKWGVNWGAVYDIGYDEFLLSTIGQIRLKAGMPLGEHDEIGGWFTIGTKTNQVDVGVTTVIIPTDTPTFQDTIRLRARPLGQGHFFWRHIFEHGADATFFLGGREDLGGAFLLGGTAQFPITDRWAVTGGGHWSDDHESRGSFDVYLGLGLYPGGNARATSVYGNRYLPYQDVANNTFMPLSVKPLFIEVAPDRAPL